MRFLYDSSVSVTMSGSTERKWKGVETVMPVTLALTVLARAVPYWIASSDNSEPSVGMRMCVCIPVPTVRLEFHRRCFPTVLYDLILDLLPLVERAQSTTLDGENVNKDILAAALRLNESIALAWIEPFDRAAAHAPSPNRRSTMSSLGRPLLFFKHDLRAGVSLKSSPIGKTARADLSVLDLDQTLGLPFAKTSPRGGNGMV